jgi:hypothetical protein
MIKTREEELLKLIKLYQNLVFGRGSIIGLIGCLDPYYTDTFNEDIAFIEEVEKKYLDDDII